MGGCTPSHLPEGPKHSAPDKVTPLSYASWP